MTNLALVLDRSPRRFGKVYHDESIRLRLPDSLNESIITIKKDFPHLSTNQIICNLIAATLEKYKYL